MADEIHYLTYDPDAIWDKMQEAYLNAGGDPLYPGDEKEMLLRSVQADIVQVFAGVDNALRMQTLRYATGDYLDLLGEGRGCPRITEHAATGNIKITHNNPASYDESYRTIAKGTMVTADGEVAFTIDNDITLNGASNVVYGTITCTKSGDAGNGIAEGQTMTLLYTNNPMVVSIQCVYGGCTGGRDTETDDEYRERIRTYAASVMTVGTKEQYEAAVLQCDSRIKQAYARLVNNVARIDIVSDGVEADVAAVAKSIMIGNGLTALGYDVTVEPAPKITYTLVLSITRGSMTSAEINAAIEEYKAWQDNVLGRSFTPEKLIGTLLTMGCRGVTINTGSDFGGGAAKYTYIEPYQRCSGTIRWS